MTKNLVLRAFTSKAVVCVFIFILVFCHHCGKQVFKKKRIHTHTHTPGPPVTLAPSRLADSCLVTLAVVVVHYKKKPKPRRNTCVEAWEDLTWQLLSLSHALLIAHYTDRPCASLHLLSQEAACEPFERGFSACDWS